MSLCLLPPLSTSPLVPLSILLSLLHVIPHFLHIFHLLSFMSLSLILTSSLSRSFSPPLTIYNSLCISATLHLAPSLLSLPSFLQFSLSLSPYSGHISHPVHVSTLSHPSFNLRLSPSTSLSLSHPPFIYASLSLHLSLLVSLSLISLSLTTRSFSPPLCIYNSLCLTSLSLLIPHSIHIPPPCTRLSLSPSLLSVCVKYRIRC